MAREHDAPAGESFPVWRKTSYTVRSLVEHARKLSCRGAVLMIVSPSRPQVVVVATASRESGLYEVGALLFRFRKSLLPSAPLSEIVLPIVK